MLNMISKQPKAKENQRFSYSIGDQGSDRVFLEATGPLYRGSAGKTNYVLTLAHFQKEFDQEYARHSEFGLGLKAAQEVFARRGKTV